MLDEDDDLSSYKCRQFNLEFKKPCNITECIGHYSRFKRVNPQHTSLTNCVYHEFRSLVEDEIDYANEEQGRLGYRDIEYIETVLKIPNSLLRKEYEKQQDLIKGYFLIITRYAKYHEEGEHKEVCEDCGREKCSKGFDCKSDKKLFDAFLSKHSSLHFLPRTFLFNLIQQDRKSKQIFIPEYRLSIEEQSNAA